MSNSFLFHLAGATALATSVLAVPAFAGSTNRGLETEHQPVVQRSDFVLDVRGDGLDRAEAARIRQWFDMVDLSYGDRISIDGPERAESNRDIATIVSTYGLFVSEGAPVTEGAVAPGQVRIVVSRSTASVPGCPDYGRPSQPNFSNSASSNFGCATSSMLAAMVANPDDLIRGQEGGSGRDADTASKAIRAWRTAEPTGKQGIKIETTKGGN